MKARYIQVYNHPNFMLFKLEKKRYSLLDILQSNRYSKVTRYFLAEGTPLLTWEVNKTTVKIDKNSIIIDGIEDYHYPILKELTEEEFDSIIMIHRLKE